MRGLWLAGLLMWAAAAQASPTWDSLWSTPDQRAQQLLHQGKPAEASRLFQDPRRKAYAELQAGNFLQAAQDFAVFGDSDGQYNRGNALARAGHLQEAIQAYDAALARDPNNRDARHNRELVAKALQTQPPKTQSASGQSRQGNKNQDAQKQGDPGKQKQDSGTQNGEVSKPSSNNTAQAGKQDRNQAGGAQTKPAGQGQPQQGQTQPDQTNPGQPSDRRNTDANGSQQGQAANDAAQARNDAAAGLAKPQALQAPQAATRPSSERQLAEEQWLRRIPDDPGGLLRHKFMIEHLIRQQGTQP
ncbi:tetratricopeptide repeat protein [Thiobacillus thioparus]|uniref:tetratricopeptide repeat protein n=1 Tax=Thiobacillus thioparus TaxID=931 RepID=UPI000370CD24|nr:tetratricopeptide repeat protein [Thiobacillus thioparus]